MTKSHANVSKQKRDKKKYIQTTKSVSYQVTLRVYDPGIGSQILSSSSKIGQKNGRKEGRTNPHYNIYIPSNLESVTYNEYCTRKNGRK